MITDRDALKLMEQMTALQLQQAAFELELRSQLLAIVAFIERKHGIGKYGARKEGVEHAESKRRNPLEV
jgi:hypothetical protein